MADFDKDEDTGSEEEEDTSEDEDTENEGADSDGDDSEEEDEDDADSEEEDEDDDAGNGKGDKSKKSSKKDESKDDDEEPQKRPRSVADFVALRRGKAAKKAGKQNASDQGKDDGDDDEEDGEDAGEKPLTPKDLEKALTPFMQREEETRVDADISAFIATNPDLKPYAAKARKYALHPNRRDIPIKAIFYEVAGDDLLKIGAKRAKKADVEGKKSRTGGDSGGRGDEGDGSSVWKLPKKDFERMQQEIRAKQ